ncbi:hypothetical protein O181_042605 [Austropuccinia psidii MF-1]|uniref:Integrase catalytic domain-containing protein n=1 Tax=Austropuccinia psidii MF-1 TaxID=1389203 RepID=A0A9Q3DGY3_9BASI|nr:hypothetical protein [Austropuccinia psidii MF-1]
MLSFSRAYHLQTNGLAERMIQTSEDMIKKFCAYGLEFKDSDAFTKDWCTLIPALLPADTLRKDLIDIHPTASNFNIMLYKVKNHAKQSMNHAFDYAKQKWDKSHQVPDFKVGDLALVSTLNFNNIKCPKKLKYYYVGHFFIFASHETNSVKVEFSHELENKHPTFTVSLIRAYHPAEK